MLTAKAALLAGAFAGLALAQLNIGFLGGYAGGIAKSAIPGYDASKWEPATTYGGTLNYRFRRGISLGLRAEQLTLKMTEEGDDLGTLKLQPILATIGYQTARPEGKRGFGGHAQFGGGIALTKFKNGAMTNAIVNAYNARMTVTVDRPPIFEAGGGIDYFLNRWVAITSDFRLLMGNTGTRWRISNGPVYSDMDITKLYTSTGQVLGGIRIWLK